MKKNRRIASELLSLAGEHRVASELCKLGLFATITSGNRKQTDLYAINDTAGRFVRIEVKASQTKNFLTRIGQKKVVSGYNPPQFWVLVSFGQGGERFFVLENREIERLQEQVNEEPIERFRKKNPGKEYDQRDGVDGIPVNCVEKPDYENRWDKIAAAVGLNTVAT
jgi:hypothetical protein